MNNLSIFLMILTVSLSVLLAARFFYLRQLKRIKKNLIDLKSANIFKRLRPDSGDWTEIINEFNEITRGIYARLEKMTLEKNELQAIIASMAEGVIIIDAKQCIQFVSANLNEMLEMRSQQAVGKLFWEVIRSQEVKDSIKQALDEKHVVRKEIAVLGQNESHFSIQISPVFSPQKELVSIAAVFHDITELAQFERMRSEFVANVSHELKTPLTSIKGFVETLQAGAIHEKENARRFLEIIARKTEHLEHLVQNLLTLSVLESKESAMECRKESLGPVLQSVIEFSRGHLEKKNHQMTLEIAPHLPSVFVERQRIEQVFINLLDNAIKFTPAQGTISIDAVKDNGFVRVDIKDSGVGIAPEHLSRIFERFYRVDKARSTDMGGTGLGLAIVKHILQAHQGKIAVQSVVNQGTTFSVYLPAAS